MKYRPEPKPRFLRARYAGRCAETWIPFHAGDDILWFPRWPDGRARSDRSSGPPARPSPPRRREPEYRLGGLPWIPRMKNPPNCPSAWTI